MKQSPFDDDPEWVSDVRRGEWRRIPDNLTYYDSVPLAYLINGYEISKRLGADHASDLCYRAWGRYDAVSQMWSGSAVQLWVTLFYVHRADHFSAHFVPVDPPADYQLRDPYPPRPELDALCRALRAALVEGRLWPEQ